MSKRKLKEAYDLLVLSFGKDEELSSFFDSLKNKIDSIQENSLEYKVFSDGACRGNPGPGAWAALGENAFGDSLFEASGVESLTTNNRMELLGAINALYSIRNHIQESNLDFDSVIIKSYSDSKYVIDGISSWLPSWKKKGWKKSDGKAPENLDLWKELDEITSQFKNLEFIWVKGHAGHLQNERCDQIANKALDECGF